MPTQTLIIPAEQISSAIAWQTDYAAPMRPLGAVLQSRAIAVDCGCPESADRLSDSFGTRPAWRRSGDVWLGLEIVDPTMDEEHELAFARDAVMELGLGDDCEIGDCWIARFGFRSEDEMMAFHRAADAGFISE